jgi:hypothetical protein
VDEEGKVEGFGEGEIMREDKDHPKDHSGPRQLFKGFSTAGRGGMDHKALSPIAGGTDYAFG